MTTARPFLMFQGGVAQAALDLYFSTFPGSGIVRVELTFPIIFLREKSKRIYQAGSLKSLLGIRNNIYLLRIKIRSQTLALRGL